MSHRLSLRVLAVAALTGTALLPATVAFADDDPAPSERVTERSPSPSPAPADGSDRPTAVPRGGVDAGDKPTPAPATEEVTRRTGTGPAPRGGVDAGEQPAGSAVGSTTAVAGSAAAVAVLAGAGAVVVRRRSAAHSND